MTSLTYVFAVGPGRLARQGKLLLNSILKNTTATQQDIYAYVVKEEKKDISDEFLDYFEKRTVLIEGSMPNSEYPLSAAHAALLAASKKTNNDYLLLLDVDTIVLNPINIHNQYSADLYIKPVDLGNRYWASQKSQDSWRQLYTEYDLTMPDSRSYSTVDDKEIIPYYNGGVILTANNNFPKRWLELSDQIYGTLEKDNFFTEQVSLALLASDYDVHEFNEKYNYPLQFYLSLPSDVNIIHYNNDKVLERQAFSDKKFYHMLKEIGYKKTKHNKLVQYLYFAHDIYMSKYSRRTNRLSMLNLFKSVWDKINVALR
jgi:hypothetical protein